jgi:hypothetical protein
VFKEGGLFTQHQEGEFDRLGGRFGKYYGQWEAGEALRNAGFYSKPMFPNGPNMLQTAAIAGSFAGPWAAVAVNLVATGIQVADGTTHWKHAGVQMGVGMATSMSGSFSPLVGMVGGGIKYEEGGGIGWSKKQFKEGVKSGVVKTGLQFVTNSTFATETIMSGIETDGKWYELGFDNSNWTQHIVTGLAAQISEGVTAVTGNSTAGSFLQQGLLTAAYNIRDGQGFKDDYSSLNWGVFNPGAQQLGSLIGGMASQYLKKAADNYGAEQNRSRMPENPGDPFGTVENLLGGMWYGMRKLGESVSNMYTNVIETTGLGNMIDTVKGWGEKVNSWADTSRSIFGVADSVLTNIGGAIGAGMMGAASRVKDTAVSAWNGVKNVATSVVNSVAGAVSTAVGAVGTFAEKTGNWFSGDGFNTDDEVAEIQTRQRIQEAIRNGTALEEGSEEYKRIQAELYGKSVTQVGNSGSGLTGMSEDIRRLKEVEKSINGDKNVDIKRFSQKELDERLNNKGNCKFAGFMILAEARMRAEGQNTETFDPNKVYDETKKEGDKIIKGNSYILSPDKLIRKAGVQGDISWGRETDPTKFNDTLVEQLDKGNPVMMILDDKHGEVIYGYEKSGNNLRFLVHDVGYQGDTYLNSKTWQPYRGNGYYSTKGGLPEPFGTRRAVTKLLYLK